MLSQQPNSLTKKADEYLNYFCRSLPDRHTGSAGNRSATDFFANAIEGFGFHVDTPSFECIDWHPGGVSLTVAGKRFPARISPYSNAVELTATLASCDARDDLTAEDITGKILLLSGPLTKEQLMPKNFPFYNPEDHQDLIRTLEEGRPAAIIAATGIDPGTAGGLSPFPLFEDGDFHIPSVFLEAVEGERLAMLAGQPARLSIEAQRVPSRGCNVIARSPGFDTPKIVVCAHIDSKAGSPGAIDNAAGIVTLLLLAERLQEYHGRTGIEIVAMNGEDYYAATGEIHYLERFLGEPADTLIAVNIDGAGFKEGMTAYSTYQCPPELERIIHSTFRTRSGFTEGTEWYQSDHSLFIQKGIPALAFTSDQFERLWSEIAHTPEDRPEIVALPKLVDLSSALYEFIRMLEAA